MIANQLTQVLTMEMWGQRSFLRTDIINRRIRIDHSGSEKLQPEFLAIRREGRTVHGARPIGGLAPFFTYLTK